MKTRFLTDAADDRLCKLLKKTHQLKNPMPVNIDLM
uniref:Uncharacterized protein n=1 Tax=Romanomermis culicivorax TaxID=13658 RepID=A0A915J0W6_ROMCU